MATLQCDCGNTIALEHASTDLIKYGIQCTCGRVVHITKSKKATQDNGRTAAVGFRIPSDWYRGIEEYRRQEQVNFSEACRRLLGLGLRTIIETGEENE